MATDDTRIVDVPAPDQVEAPAPRKPRKATTKATTKRKPRGKDLVPKEFAAQLGIDPKKLRRILREIYGVQHKAWTITPDMQKAVRARLKK